MHEFRDGYGNIFCLTDDERIERFKKWNETQKSLYCYEKILGFMRFKPYKKIIKERAIPELPTFCVLDSHGNIEENEWLYWHNDSPDLVQNWINRYDGLATALLIFSCNTTGVAIQSKKSVVVHPTEDVDIVDIHQSPSKTKLYIPGRDYHPVPTFLEKLNHKLTSFGSPFFIARANIVLFDAEVE